MSKFEPGVDAMLERIGEAKISPQEQRAEHQTALLGSIAMSLKRIADELAGTEKTGGLVGAIYDTLQRQPGGMG